MRVPITVCLFFAVLGMLGGCAAPRSVEPSMLTMDTSRLPPADLALNIAGLGPCVDTLDRTLHLDSTQPLTILVHGCFGSAGRFRALAQVYAFQGQQTACFSYNDRDSLVTSTAELRQALAALVPQMPQMHNRQINLIGHSQGGLIARRALVAEGVGEGGQSLQALDARFSLVTISSPFAGIAAAKHCGSTALKVASLGLVLPICQMVTGSKWRDITYSSDFITHPGRLIGQVTQYVKLETDEQGSCRRVGEGQKCLESDYIFGLAEQVNPLVDAGGVVTVERVKAGHVEITGDEQRIPYKLINVLQQSGLLHTTPVARRAAFEQLLASLYLPAP
jgi:hypothetical protein